jgi:tetratricopeptide (TPR) repeat protein
MTTSPLEELIAWLRSSDPPPERLIAELVALNLAQWHQLAENTKSIVTIETARELIARSRNLAGADARMSAYVAFIATYAVLLIDAPDEEATQVTLVSGDAWREYAAALFDCGEYADAEEACDSAKFFYQLEPAKSGHSMALLGIVLGKTLHRLNRSGERDKALHLVESSSNFLLMYDDKRGYATGRTTYAALLWEDQRYSDALEALQASAAFAKDERDAVMMAYIINNIGLCHLGLSEFDEAKECFNQAMAIFTRHGLRAEVPRSRGGLVRILIAEEKYNEAVSELYKSRSDYLELDMPVIAAEVQLELVDLLMVSGRTDAVPSLCDEMITTFTEARLPSSVMKVLAHIRDYAHRGLLQREHVHEAKAFVERVAEHPDAAFGGDGSDDTPAS